MQYEHKRTKGPFERIIDEHIGKRIIVARHARKITQSKLAEILGLTFQQIQKYEKSQNRISASRLWNVVCAMNFPIGFFFNDLPDTITNPYFSHDLTDPFQRSDVIELVSAYLKLQRNFPVTAKKFSELLTQTTSSSTEI